MLGPDAEVVLLLGVDAGLRMSEIPALQWTGLALRGWATVTVSRTREGDEEYAPKGWKSRVVLLSPRLVGARPDGAEPAGSASAARQVRATADALDARNVRAEDASIAKLAEEVAPVTEVPI